MVGIVGRNPSGPVDRSARLHLDGRRTFGRTVARIVFAVGPAQSG